MPPPEDSACSDVVMPTGSNWFETFVGSRASESEIQRTTWGWSSWGSSEPSICTHMCGESHVRDDRTKCWFNIYTSLTLYLFTYLWIFITRCVVRHYVYGSLWVAVFPGTRFSRCYIDNGGAWISLNYERFRSRLWLCMNWFTDLPHIAFVFSAKQPACCSVRVEIIYAHCIYNEFSLNLIFLATFNVLVAVFCNIFCWRHHLLSTEHTAVYGAFTTQVRVLVFT